MDDDDADDKTLTAAVCIYVDDQDDDDDRDGGEPDGGAKTDRRWADSDGNLSGEMPATRYIAFGGSGIDIVSERVRQ